MNKLTVKEAIQQGYKKYGFTDRGFQSLLDLKDIDPDDLKSGNLRLVEKNPFQPSGISSKDIAELLAEHLDENHSGETGDDTNSVYEAIKDLDFSEAEEKINKALSGLNYYKFTDIILTA